jgi:phenylacetate-CoA ligase
MNPRAARAFFYYPTTLCRGELVGKYLRQYRETQYWSGERIAQAQAGALDELWRHAAARSAFWRDRLAPLAPAAGATLPPLRGFPCLEKSDLVLHTGRIITRKWVTDDVKTTGGSTGQPVQIRKSPGSLARERAATWRAYEWAGVGVADPQARIWGRPITRWSRMRYRLIDFVSNRIRLSAFDLDDAKLEQFHRRLVAFQPTYIYGYVSALREFIGFVHRRNLRLPASLRCMITTSELLTPEARLEMQERSGLRVFNEYGCGEVGSIAHECERGGLHVMAENLLLEIDADTPGGAGEVVVTDLHNTVTPLLRYRLGDFASLSPATCPCGRGLPLLEGVHGRAYDLLVMPDGRKVHPELPIYVFEEARKVVGGISQFQVVQRSPASLLLRVLKSEGADGPVIEGFLRRRFADVFPPEVALELEFVSRIDREKSGKMRVVRRLFD